MSKVMFIDGLNMFIRSYIVNPTLDKDGNPIGGCIGFLKSLQKVTNKFNPDEVIVAWDGNEGSQRKRALNKEYKEVLTPIWDYCKANVKVELGKSITEALIRSGF